MIDDFQGEDSWSFAANSLVELAAKVTTSHVGSPRELNRKVSKDLEAICLKAMDRDPRERYSNGIALAADLARALAGDTVSASSVRWRWSQRKRALRRFGWVRVAKACGPWPGVSRGTQPCWPISCAT